MAVLMSIALTVGTANVAEWAKLVLSNLRAPVLRATRIRYNDNARPLTLEEIVLPLDRIPGLATNGGDNIPDVVDLVQHHGLTLGRATERVSIVPATTDVAQHLRIAPGTHVLKLDRVIETADGVPIEWRLAYCIQTAGSPPLKPSADPA